jgi:hypothetical protein
MSIDIETASETELSTEIARLLLMRPILKARFQQKSLFSGIPRLELARERRFGVLAPKRTLRARGANAHSLRQLERSPRWFL